MSFAGPALSGAAGDFIGLFLAAFGYSEWLPHPPCNDVTVVPLAQCAMPTAPVWMLVVGALVGALAGLMLMRAGRHLHRSVRH